MMLLTPANPKGLAPPKVHDWMAYFEPNDATTKWETLDGGFFVRSPLEVWGPLGWISPGEVANLHERIRKDWTERGLFNDACLLPSFNPLLSDVDGNLWDPLHFGGVAMLVDFAKRGSDFAGQAAVRLVSSYAVNEKISYMRDGGNEKSPYMDQGRPRCAGGILLGLGGLAELFAFLKWNSGPTVSALVSLIYSHLDRIAKHFPLTAVPDGPDGDHLNVDHVETFMMGILVAGARKLAALGFAGAQDLVDRGVSIITAARQGPASYVYDLRVDPSGAPLPAASTDKINVGVSGVNAWLAPALASGPLFDELLADARAKNWPVKFPQHMAHFFGVAA